MLGEVRRRRSILSRIEANVSLDKSRSVEVGAKGVSKGMPQSTEAERIELVKNALEVANARPNAERMRLSWRTGHISATVVELPVDKVVLNPRSHRIRSQLESLPNRELVEEAPLDDDAQAIIAELLRQAEEFAGLRANVAEVGQIEPGVVTATGMLINANTRCVALRDNGGRYIRAGVLPADASPEEIDRLELRLQMKHDFQSEYTFTNELLFLDDLLREYQYTPEQIAIEMGWASRSDQRALKRMAEQVQSYTRILTLIREVQHMSGSKIPTVTFDGTRQALIELDREVEARKMSNYVEAREIRDARLVGILAGAGYRELREIGPDFVRNFLIPAMHDRPILSPHVDALTTFTDADPPAPSGLDLFEDDVPSEAEGPRRSAAALLALLTREPDKEMIELPAAEGPVQSFNRIVFHGELKTAIEGAAEDVRLNREAGDSLGRPRDLVRKATKHIQAAIEAYRDVADHPDFDEERWRIALEELNLAHASISVQPEGAKGA